MLNSIRRWLQDPTILLALVAGLATFVVQSGELGSADTMHRLQTTHSWWTPQPEVFPGEFPEFGIHGVGSRLHSWYGMGQSASDPVNAKLWKLAGKYLGLRR